MRLIAFAILATVLFAAPAGADNAPKLDAPRKICRTSPTETGSHRPGKRFCKTADEWQQFDSTTLNYERDQPGTPIRSQDVNPPQ